MDEPHRLVPLTYTFLKDIEDRNQQGPLALTKGGEYHALRAFSIIPTKKGLQCSHMKMCGLGLWALLRRAGYHMPGLQDGWKDVTDLYWRKLLNIQKFETANRKFAGEIVTDGKALSILMRNREATRREGHRRAVGT